jgi:predicted O-methyltransferase YrrM
MKGHDPGDRTAAAARIRRVIDRLMDEARVVSRADGAVHAVFPVAVTRTEGEALARWVRREGARRTIEIGMGYAASTLFICEALLANGVADAGHVAVDPYQGSRFARCGLQLIDEAGATGLVEFHPEESQLVLPRLLNESRRFDLAFVDGNHRFDAVFVDLYFLGRIVHPDGMVFVDDHQLRSVSRAVSFFVTNAGWTVEEQSPRDPLHEWVVLRTPRGEIDRPFDQLIDF